MLRKLFYLVATLILTFVCVNAQEKCGLQRPLAVADVKGRILFDYNGAYFTVKDAQVSISRRGEEAYYGVADATTETDGRFSFKELKPGKYYISVEMLRVRGVSLLEFDVVPKTANSSTDNQIEFVFGTEFEKDCGGGSVSTVKTFDDKKLSGSSADSEQDSISEISLEKTGCFGMCPIYKIILRRDGTATYIGTRFVPKIGTYQGKHEYRFERLAELIYKQGFFNLKARYALPVTDQDTAIVSVVRSGKRKTVENYGGEAPVELWGIETVIDSIANEIKWKAKTTQKGNKK